MRDALPDSVGWQVPGWLTARRYGVPGWMVEQATERRLAGDWRGACAAARMDVRVDPGEVAGQVEADLRHLVPDLVRWHVPRNRGNGTGRIEPEVTLVLARYGDAALWVRTPTQSERPQRLTLGFGPVGPDVEEWDTARYLWDARQTGGLLHRLGGGDRVPFHDRAGRRLTPDELPMMAPLDGDPVALAEWVTILQDTGQVEQAWRAVGIEADGHLPVRPRRTGRGLLPGDPLPGQRLALVRRWRRRTARLTRGLAAGHGPKWGERVDQSGQRDRYDIDV